METDSYYASKLREEERFVVVDLTVENQTPAEVSFGRLDVTLQTISGLWYEYESTSAMSGYRTIGDIAPGQSVRFPVSFKIPQDIAVAKVFYEHPNYGQRNFVLAVGGRIQIPAGDVQERRNVRLTLHGVSEHQEWDSYYASKLGPEERFVVVDLTVENSSSAEISFGRLALSVQTDDGFWYECESSSAMSGYRTIGEIAPGQSVRFPVSFKIPQDIAVAKVFYEHPNYGQRNFVLAVGGQIQIPSGDVQERRNARVTLHGVSEHQE